MVVTINVSASLAREYAVAIKCLAHSIAGGVEPGQSSAPGVPANGNSGVAVGGVTGDDGVDGGDGGVSSSGGVIGNGSSRDDFLDGVELELCRHARYARQDKYKY